MYASEVLDLIVLLDIGFPSYVALALYKRFKKTYPYAIQCVDIVFQKDPKSVLELLKFTSVRPVVDDVLNTKVDVLWQVSMHVYRARPMWSGYMLAIHQGQTNPGPRSPLFLPMIDVSPGSPKCVRSTLE